MIPILAISSFILIAVLLLSLSNTSKDYRFLKEKQDNTTTQFQNSADRDNKNIVF